MMGPGRPAASSSCPPGESPMRVSPLPTRHTVLQKGLGCWSLRVRVGERLAPSPSGLALQRRCQEASWDHVPSPHPCPANWPLKTLGDSHRVTRFRSREGSCAGGSESDPLPGVPGLRAAAELQLQRCFWIAEYQEPPPRFSSFLALCLSASFRLHLLVSSPLLYLSFLVAFLLSSSSNPVFTPCYPSWFTRHGSSPRP